MPKFSLSYHKIPKNIGFFNDLSFSFFNRSLSYHPYALENLQNYNPLYDELFHLDKNNYNKITLNHRYQFVSNNILFDTVSNTVEKKNFFVKFSPLIDPIKCMSGKYKDLKIQLPEFQNNPEEIYKKIIEPNNASYIDNFFYYLTSQLLNHYQFIHATDYYGSFLAFQEKFKCDISDDLEYLYSSDYFNTNLNVLHFVSDDEMDFHNFGSRANKKKIKISSINNKNISFSCLPEMVFTSPIDISNEFASDLIYENNNIQNTSKSTTETDDDSEVSNSTDSNEEDREEESNHDNTDTESDDEIDSDFNEDKIAFVNHFPVQAICIEKCDGTLDQLFENEQMTSSEGICALFQIIMTLLCYQKMFNFTHNDLHTNNVMYVETEQPYLYYKYNKACYKVPTYGKIYKIIDFGRSIFRFQNRLFCSDSFSPEGDATSQYNFEPYFNPEKPRIDPNFSFDLCRLGCSLYDFIIDNDEDSDNFNELQKIVQIWCTDDNNKNILYKKSGEERYPNFKLYKMIARSVHKHTPENQLKNPIFKKFEISHKKIKNKDIIMDIDDMATYM
tara:strand:+ start:2641 stop:4317 length:1677 start_codon:yes stop_codon:yes gene_type:complete